MSHTAVPITLYAANLLWFFAAFVQFSFRPKEAMLSGGRRLNSKDSKVRATPEGDAWHHDLLAYLGGINIALAALAFMRLALHVRPDLTLLSSCTTGSIAGDAPLEVLSLTILGVANFSQARVNMFVVRNTGRWTLGAYAEPIMVIDGVLTVLDWTAAAAVARKV